MSEKTTAAGQAIGYVTCPACGYDCEVRPTRPHKLYIGCEQCGFQGYTRNGGATEMLKTRMRTIAAADPPADEPATPPAKKSEPERKGWF